MLCSFGETTAVCLPGFAARPKVSIDVECQSFGMVEPFREDFEFMQ